MCHRDLSIQKRQLCNKSQVKYQRTWHLGSALRNEGENRQSENRQGKALQAEEQPVKAESDTNFIKRVWVWPESRFGEGAMREPDHEILWNFILQSL